MGAPIHILVSTCMYFILDSSSERACVFLVLINFNLASYKKMSAQIAFALDMCASYSKLKNVPCCIPRYLESKAAQFGI